MVIRDAGNNDKNDDIAELHNSLSLAFRCSSLMLKYLIIYIAPLQMGLLRSAPNPSAAEQCFFKLPKEFLEEHYRK